MDDATSPAREPLLWQNAFFGKRASRTVRLRNWFQAHNAPGFDFFRFPEDAEEAAREPRLGLFPQ